ncbi:hypothetical protein CDD83_2572 [Cordyceps sp. RAO-2017]|nr:hypothetical protein CDD83_2572 [Cordyceps sp. RAO-2017]
MAPSVTGKHAVITGAGSGICLAFARLLLQRGCSVMIGDLQLQPEAEELLKQYPYPSQDGKPSALFRRTDVVSWPQLSALWRAALEAFPTVDILVPGAGLFDPPCSSFWAPPKTETNPDTTSRDPADADPGHYTVFDVNLVSPIRMSQLAIGHWTKTKQEGCLVHIGSVAGYTAEASAPLYYASKHGLHGFVRALGKLKGSLGIRVGAVAPAAVKTAIWDKDSARADTVLANCSWVPVEKIAEAMFEIAVNEEYGDGTVLEVTVRGPRVVDPFNGQGVLDIGLPGLAEHEKQLLARLKSDGLSV